MPSDLDLHITFAEVPAIWRSVRVPDHISLEQLHHVIQLLMGWDNKHLHVFDVNGTEYGTVLEDESQGPRFAGSDGQITIAEAVERSSDSLSYTYDFGDAWQLAIRVTGRQESSPGLGVLCLAGDMAAPPEDFGGPLGYGEFLTIWRTKGKRGLSRDLRDWLPKGFDPEVFDLSEVKSQLGLMPSPIGPERSPEMKLLDDLSLAALYLASWVEKAGARRAWKGIEFDVLDRLYAAGLVSFTDAAKSLYFTPEGEKHAETLVARLKATLAHGAESTSPARSPSPPDMH